jgi:hypothetical protein
MDKINDHLLPPITRAIKIIGLTKLALELGVSYQAIRKWEAAGRLPRTEWTGETAYAKKIEAASKGVVTEVELHKRICS